MGYIERSYRFEQGEYGTMRIIQYGRCDGSSSTMKEIEEDCSDGHVEALPNAKGVAWKPHDGTNPSTENITPTTKSKTYECIKVFGHAWPLAPKQDGGVLSGSTVMEYEIIWQQVGVID